MSVRLIVFDLDGTLVDSREDIADSANATLVSYGAPPLSEDAIGRMVGDGAPTLIARAFAAAASRAPADALDRFLSIYDARLLNHTRPYAGIPELLAELASRSTLAVLTNKPLAAARRILAGLDLSRHFEPDRVVGGDGPFPRKPDPRGLAHLMALAGAKADATRSGRRLGDRLAHGVCRRNEGLPRALWLRLGGLPDRTARPRHLDRRQRRRDASLLVVFRCGPWAYCRATLQSCLGPSQIGLSSRPTRWHHDCCNVALTLLLMSQVLDSAGCPFRITNHADVSD